MFKGKTSFCSAMFGEIRHIFSSISGGHEVDQAQTFICHCTFCFSRYRIRPLSEKETSTRVSDSFVSFEHLITLKHVQVLVYVSCTTTS